MKLVKSRQRVTDHGEVFTSRPMVQAMLDMVKAESERIDSRFLEPACGSGNFLIPVLLRKFATVEARYGKSEFEKRHQALLALMCVYGIELLHDNVRECRESLSEAVCDFLGVAPSAEWAAAARRVADVNVVHGDALSMVRQDDRSQQITFAEWSYLGKGNYRRRDFRFDTLTQMASFGAADTLFADLGKHELFTPVRDYPLLTVSDLARDGDWP